MKRLSSVLEILALHPIYFQKECEIILNKYVWCLRKRKYCKVKAMWLCQYSR